MPLQFKLLSRLCDVVHVKLKPSLWRRKFVGPEVLTKAGLCCLRERPQSESLCPFQRLGMKIAAILFFEANTEDLVVQVATCTRRLLKKSFKSSHWQVGDLLHNSRSMT